MYDTSGNRPLSPLDVLNMLEDIHGKVALKTNVHMRRCVLCFFFHFQTIRVNDTSSAFYCIL